MGNVLPFRHPPNIKALIAECLELSDGDDEFGLDEFFREHGPYLVGYLKGVLTMVDGLAPTNAKNECPEKTVDAPCYCGHHKAQHANNGVCEAQDCTVCEGFASNAALDEGYRNALALLVANDHDDDDARAYIYKTACAYHMTEALAAIAAAFIDGTDKTVQEYARASTVAFGL